eukprot:CAMPEP_0115853384 /NCGR_PEP_ID=MMETSP0287-20121206/13476_1 /TAXON_ID=412157 /ORGANISM="Chrysochromulina rotalis, Strain UIO044" /LENGTH=256 /DNA_ID=CAMNT_0003307459 /DNA_START=722 /DNA_END=1493 /DNA_ORIENTATION=-
MKLSSNGVPLREESSSEVALLDKRAANGMPYSYQGVDGAMAHAIGGTRTSSSPLGFIMCPSLLGPTKFGGQEEHRSRRGRLLSPLHPVLSAGPPSTENAPDRSSLRSSWMTSGKIEVADLDTWRGPLVRQPHPQSRPTARDRRGLPVTSSVEPQLGESLRPSPRRSPLKDVLPSLGARLWRKGKSCPFCAVAPFCERHIEGLACGMTCTGRRHYLMGGRMLHVPCGSARTSAPSYCLAACRMLTSPGALRGDGAVE